MTRLLWDQVGDRKFQLGIDRGVLYLGADAVPWNGLTGFDEAVNRESQSYYQDGIKYLENHVLGEFGGTLRCFTYPDEFGECIGESNEGHGIVIYDQPPKTFGLSYRTMLGDDIEGVDAGYMIHVLYNLRAVPAGAKYASMSDAPAAAEFSFAVGGTPEAAAGYRPTSHVAIRSTDLSLGLLAYLEDILYGSSLEPPYLPSISELIDIIETPLTIVDNGDGTFTVTGSSRAVVMLSDTSFQINGLDATFPTDDSWQAEEVLPE